MTKRRAKTEEDPLARFHEPTQAWFRAAFAAPTGAQTKGWPSILDGASTLLLAPTGSGKTLAAFLVAVDRLVFSAEPPKDARLRLLYVSPLKALASDVERNLRAPLLGITAAAARMGKPFRTPTVALRSGDTPPAERARLAKKPPDILITTPESLFLLLTSNARETLRSIDTVIVDEIHSLVGTKRGAHLFLSLERLEALRGKDKPAFDDGATLGRAELRPKPLTRIGLSATQRPLDEVARLLGGVEIHGDKPSPRPVVIVDASAPKTLELSIEVPEGAWAATSGKEKSEDPAGRSIWPTIHPRLVELVRAHRSTMIFANSRRLSERLAAAINETAGEEIAAAHHGSLAREERFLIEERLKEGSLPCIVATSSLELGLDLGAVDLVIQIEAPPSVAAGLQRVGRAGHAVGAASRGVVFPKHRGDLLACAAATERMLEGKVEATFYPRNPLDVLAQQIVAAASMDAMHEDALFSLVRRAAPFTELPRASFDGVLDMLSGRYPSDEFAELRPRIVWDRTTGAIRAREGTKRLVVVNAGTIPDRGLYGVFLATNESPGRRVGELDEEMVFEAREGEVFRLGASSWRITEITHDRVLVLPAPGEPGKMPFWRGDRVGRGEELGQAIGALARAIAKADDEGAARFLQKNHKLDPNAAESLVRYVRDQQRATGEVPSDKTIVIERFVDEVGDTRVCLLSPFGGRVHAPLASAIGERAREELGLELEAVWSDDGIAFRFPEAQGLPDARRLLPRAEEVEDLVVASLGASALFAGRFRECAGRALLLPKNRPGTRTPLWARRKRAADLLAVAAQYGSFPILLETYREVLRDVFDMPALTELLKRIEAREVRVHEVETRAASPFAASLLFGYVGNFMYDGDLPLAERKAQMLAIDHARLRELLGEAELRELLDASAIETLGRALQRLDGKRPVDHEDRVHDMLLSLGDLSLVEIEARSAGGVVSLFCKELVREKRIFEALIGGEPRLVAAEDAGRLRDALGLAIPPGLPAAFLEPVRDPLVDLVSRYARTHAPFRAEDVARRFGLGVAVVRSALATLIERRRVTEGELLPGGSGREYCDIEVLRSLKQRSLARLRAEVEPVGPEAFARFLLDWHGIHRPRRGPEALLSAVELLQGAPLSAAALETEILPARVESYRLGDLDALCAAGEVVWRGVEAVGETSGRIALYLAQAYPWLAPPKIEAEGPLPARVREALGKRGAMFFGDLLRETGGFGHDLLAAIWALVWAGEVTNDTLSPLRSLGREDKRSGRRREQRSSRFFGGARRPGPPGSEGRWSLLPAPSTGGPSETEKRAALARVLLDRHGVLTREAAAAEGIVGGFSAVYDVLRAMEEAGKVRRGYFVAGLGAAQFALPGADDRLRGFREESPTTSESRPLVLSAADPASPWGNAVRFPGDESAGGLRPKRAAGARVVLYDGRLLGWLGKGREERVLLTFLPSDEPERGALSKELARALAGLVDEGRMRVLLIGAVDGEPTDRSPLAKPLREAGFVAMADGYLKRPSAAAFSPSARAPGSRPADGWGRPWASGAAASHGEEPDDLDDED